MGYSRLESAVIDSGSSQQWVVVVGVLLGTVKLVASPFFPPSIVTLYAPCGARHLINYGPSRAYVRS